MHQMPPAELNLSNLICEAGLRYDPRGAKSIKGRGPLYGEHAACMLPKNSTVGQVSAAWTSDGASFEGIYHHPDQLACALKRLSQLRIRSMIEVGVSLALYPPCPNSLLSCRRLALTARGQRSL